MTEPVNTFMLLRGALTATDVAFLKRACQHHLAHEDSISSYVLVDNLSSPVYQKIKQILERQIDQTLYYLNDFYFYTDDTFQANWHMDTELFTFDHCMNAWILLSPGEVQNPVAFISGINDSPSNYYHSLKIKEDECIFVNYCNRKQETKSLKLIEAEKIDTPLLKVGDILVINPKTFHRTNTTKPKHAIIIKFLVKGKKGVFSETQVPEMFWLETALFNELVNNASQWEDVLGALRQKLKTPEGRKTLSAGFYPEKIDFYKRMVKLL